MAEGKWIHGLVPEMPVTDAARVVLAGRFEVVRHYLPLAAGRADENAEDVHQLRVGTRRAGAALRAFAGCLPRKHLKAAKESLRGLRQAAGDARDGDVFLQRLAVARGRLTDPAARPALDFLTGHALGERAAAQARLAAAAAAAGPAYAPDTTLLPALTRRPKGVGAPQSFGDLATSQLDRLFGRFREAVAADPEDAHALHQLRILGKRVRYAVELFAGCYAPPLRGAVYPAVAEVQEVLGAVQDAAVGVARLEGLRETARRTVAAEWPRLAPGFDALVAEHRAAIGAGRGRFRAWRARWDEVTAEHPLEALRLVPEPA